MSKKILYFDSDSSDNESSDNESYDTTASNNSEGYYYDPESLCGRITYEYLRKEHNKLEQEERRKISINRHYIRNTHDTYYTLDNNELYDKLTKMIKGFSVDSEDIYKKVLLLNRIKFELVMRQIKEPLCSRRLFVKKRGTIFNMSTKNITFKFK